MHLVYLRRTGTIPTRAAMRCPVSSPKRVVTVHIPVGSSAVAS
jgi:hypothetical protein